MTQMTQNDSIAGGSSGDESDVETEPGLTLKRKVFREENNLANNGEIC